MVSKAIVTRKNKFRTWSDLPQEILESIKKRLFFAGQLTFSAVCKSWSSIGNSFPPQKQIPWLIVFFECTWSTCKLVDPTSSKTYNIHHMKAIKEKKKIKDFNTMQVHESKYGWLFISSYHYNQSPHSKTSLFLYSPFYQEKNNLIELPDLQYTSGNSWSLATFTCTSNPLEADCLFLIVIALTNGTVIRTCRRGDKSWTSWDSYFPVGKFVTWTRWMYYEGESMFYYIDADYKMGTYDFARKKWSVIPPPPRPPISSSLEPPPLPTIVKTDGEEELIFLVVEPADDLEDYFIQYIYRLDLSSMIWERVKSLGDNVLFIGDGYNSVLKLSEMKMKGISPDTVYYCSGSELNRYCTADCFPMNHGSHQDDSFDYGSMATKLCRKIFIDPPPHHHH